jgi:hypothetical protein
MNLAPVMLSLAKHLADSLPLVPLAICTSNLGDCSCLSVPCGECCFLPASTLAIEFTNETTHYSNVDCTGTVTGSSSVRFTSAGLPDLVFTGSEVVTIYTLMCWCGVVQCETPTGTVIGYTKIKVGYVCNKDGSTKYWWQDSNLNTIHPTIELADADPCPTIDPHGGYFAEYFDGDCTGAAYTSSGCSAGTNTEYTMNVTVNNNDGADCGTPP